MKVKNVLSLLSAALIGVSAAAFPTLGVSAEGEDENVVVNDDFEDGSVGKWSAFGGGNLTAVSYVSHTGEYSIRITERSKQYQGPSLSCDYCIPGEDYEFDCWVYHENPEPIPIAWTIKATNYFGEDSFHGITSADVPPKTWTELKGTLTMPEESAAYLMYIESTNETAEYFVDTVTVKGKKAEGVTEKSTEFKDIYKFEFEEDTQGWGPRGGVRVVHTDDISHSGNYSIFCSNRTEVWNGPILDVNDIAKKDTSYHYSTYVYYDGEEYEDSHTFRLEMQYVSGGSDHYDTISVKEVQKGKWTEIEGFYTIPPKAENVSVYVQTDNLAEGETADASDLMSFYIDDFVITKGSIIKGERRRKLIKTIIIVSVSVIILAIVLFKVIRKITRNNAAIKNASVDSMTKMFSRNTYEKRIAEFEKDPNLCSGYYFCLCDVNFMKYINDNFGHEKGDEAIIRCAQLLKRAVGKAGDIYRVGGDEFVCIAKIPLKDVVTAAISAESEKETDYPFKIASGFAEYDAEKFPDIKAIIAECDRTMYENKKIIKDNNSDFSRQ